MSQLVDAILGLRIGLTIGLPEPVDFDTRMECMDEMQS